MAYSENKKIGGLDQVSLPMGDSVNIVVEQSGTAKRATLLQLIAKVFSIPTDIPTTVTSDSAVVVRQDGSVGKTALTSLVPANSVTNTMLVGNITDNKLEPISTVGKVLDSATTATADNTNDAIVKRDGSGNFEANIVTATLNGNATSATNVSGGAANDLLYQSASGVTAKLASTSAASGKYLRCNGPTNAPTWESFAATSSVADDITGGSTGALVYQQAPSTTDFIAPGATGSVLTSTGTANTPGWTNTATISAVADTIVKRDSLGNFAGGTITATKFSGNLEGEVTGNVTGSSGSCTGNAATATKWKDGRTFSLTGDVTGSATSVDGSTNVSISCTVGDDSHNHSALTSATNANTFSTIVKRDASGNFSAGTISATSFSGGSISGTTGAFSGAVSATGGFSGNATTATKLNSARTFELTGTVTGEVSSDLTSGATIASDVNWSGLTNDTALLDADSILLQDSSDSTTKKASLSVVRGFNKPVLKTSAYTAVAGDRITANTTAGAFTITLPTAPEAYTEVTIADYFNKWSTNNLTVARGGTDKINGLSENLVCDIGGKEILLRYESATIGWRIYT